MASFKTIVVAMDFSENAEEALTAALALLEGTDRRLELVNVVPSPMQQAWMAQGPGIDFGALQRAWVDATTDEFEALMKRRRLDPATVATHVVVGRPDDEIVRFVEERGADLLVMGTRGHGGMKRFLLGSVADHVVRQANCPVLVVPSRLSADDTAEADAPRRR
jgi:nucleotide-binding universal stress UspA family protein